jgi:hypothetical protein
MSDKTLYYSCEFVPLVICLCGFGAHIGNTNPRNLDLTADITRSDHKALK